MFLQSQPRFCQAAQNRIDALLLTATPPAFKRLHYTHSGESAVSIHLFLQGRLAVFSRRNVDMGDFGLVRLCSERMIRKLISPWTSSWTSPSIRDKEDATTEF